MWSIFWDKKSTPFINRGTYTSNQSRGTQIYGRPSSRLSLCHGTWFCVDPPNPEKHLQTVPEVQEGLVQSSISTVPYAISKWPESSSAYAQEAYKKPKLAVKSESISAISSPKTPPLEPRGISCLEEKRVIFQRRRFISSADTSDDTVIAVTVDEESAKSFLNPEEEQKEQKIKRKARHISVRKFDTFSTFEGTFDEDTGVGYLAGIEEDHPENHEKQNEDYANFQDNMAHILAENADKSRSLSQDSAVRILQYRS